MTHYFHLSKPLLISYLKHYLRTSLLQSQQTYFYTKIQWRAFLVLIYFKKYRIGLTSKLDKCNEKLNFLYTIIAMLSILKAFSELPL